jgi:tRNA threonylcarbamoyladenosine biosynthesis protein TsaB
MLVLGIDTATDQVSCAVGGHEGVLASMRTARSRAHAESLAPAIEFVCAQARIELNEVGAVAVDVGPGLYTGLRVGIATAKALAFSLGVPMVGLPSLDLLAFPVRFSNRLVAAVVDARRGEVFWALYRQVPGGVQRVKGPAVGSPDDLVNELLVVGDEILMVGDGALRYAEVFEALTGVEQAGQGLEHPGASSLVQLAHARALREEFVSHEEITPLYLRQPDAVRNFEERTPGLSGRERGPGPSGRERDL